MVRTTAVGSWPPPFGLRPRLRPFWRGERSEDDPEVHQDLVAAARIAMDDMLACGLDQITGGEVFAPDFVHTVPPRLHGLEVIRARDISLGQQGVARYRIAGPISAPGGTGHAKPFRRERAIEPALDKATVPSPFTIALSFPDDPALDHHLPDLVAMAANEIREMVSTSCGYGRMPHDDAIRLVRNLVKAARSG
jgi:methionine synthase II (cobalamin-independent)